MPRGPKKPATAASPSPSPATAARRTSGQTLRLETDNLRLTIESADSALIERLMSQINWASSLNSGMPAAAPASRRPGGRPAASPAPAAPKASPRSGGVSRSSVRAVLAKAQPANHEQRLLLFGLAAEQSGATQFTTGDLGEHAADLGVTPSTIPGSVSKLKKGGLLSTSRSGRSAFYALTRAGRELAQRISAGEVGPARRGPRPVAAKPATKPVAKAPMAKAPAPAATPAAAPVAAKRGPGRPKGAAAKPAPAQPAAAAAPAGAPAKPAKAAKPAKPAKGGLVLNPAAKKPAQPRPAATLDALTPDDQQLAGRIGAVAVSADEKGAFGRLKTPKDRALFILQQFASDAPAGMSPTLISYVLFTRHGVVSAANGVGAALKKALPSKFVNLAPDGRYAITIEGRSHLASQTAPKG